MGHFANRFNVFRTAFLATALLAIIAVLINAAPTSAQGPEPTGLTISSWTSTSIALTWDTFTGAIGYELIIQKNAEDTSIASSADETGDYTFRPSPITGTTATISGITAGNSYTIKVRAILTGDPNRTEWSDYVTHSTPSGKTATQNDQTGSAQGPVGKTHNWTRIPTSGITIADNFYKHIKGTNFLMVWKGVDETGPRLPAYEAHSSACGNSSASESSFDRAPAHDEVYFEHSEVNDDDQFQIGYRYRGHSATGTRNYPPTSEERWQFSKTPNPCDRSFTATKTDIWNNQRYIYIKDKRSLILEAYAITNYGQHDEELTTREPTKDIPLKREHAISAFIGIGKSPDPTDTDHIYAAARNIHTIKAVLHRYKISTQQPDPDTASQIQAPVDAWDFHFTQRGNLKEVYFTQGGNPAVVKYNYSTNNNTYLIDTSTRTEVHDNNIFPRGPFSISGFQNIIFILAYVGADQQIIKTWDAENSEIITTRFDQTTINEEYIQRGHCDRGCYVTLSTDDGIVIYITNNNGDILRFVAGDTTDSSTTFRVPENSAPSTFLTGFYSVDAPYPPLSWEFNSTGQNDIHNCFSHTPLGSHQLTIRMQLAETLDEQCVFDHEATQSYTIAATITWDDQFPIADTEEEITIQITDVEEPPPAPTDLTISNGPTLLKADWTHPILPDGVPPVTHYNIALIPAPGESAPTCPGENGPFDTIGNPGAQPPDPPNTFTKENLPENTRYKVCLRSAQHEGVSDWVESLTTTLNSPYSNDITSNVDIDENSVDVFQFNVADADGDHVTIQLTGENGPLFQTDVDPDNATHHSLSFISAPNFEDPAQGTNNKYDLTIRLTSGTETASATKDYQVAVTVRDIDELPTGLPTINGGIEEGDTLTVSTADISDEDGIRASSWQYQWQRSAGDSFTDISGESSTSYPTDHSDAGQNIRIVVSYSDSFGTTDLQSEPVGPIAENVAPTIAEPHQHAVEENHSTPFSINVTDRNNTLGNTLDPIRSVTIQGNDSADFNISHQDTETTATITFKTTPNFEKPVDSRRNNVYDFTIKAMSGDGTRVRQTSQTFTITVSDVDEPPTTPDAPTFTGTKQKRTTVVWQKPTNTGPEITKYTIRYKLASESAWTSANTTQVTSKGANPKPTGIANLEQHTLYEFQVMAHNPEGDSAWSPSGTVTTNENMPPVINPINDASISRSIAENTAANSNIGAPIDADDADITDGGAFTFSLSGADAEHFIIETTGDKGQIKTKSPLDYENRRLPYSIEVEVSDGQGGSASKPATITITNVVENPDQPARPNVTPGANRSLLISWTQPGLNGGPEITSYNVEYREGGSGSWTDINHTGITTDATITTGLEAGTLYRVRVRAKNAENGISPYSDHTDASTNDNIKPNFSEDLGSGISRSFNETFGNDNDTGRNVGLPVIATDPDGGTITYQLRGQDPSSFEINNSNGQISTKSGKKYDREAKSSYEVIVRASDSHPGESPEHTDTRVTITVNDLTEKPAKLDPTTFTHVQRFSLRANWNRKNNSGRPAITGHDIQYAKGSTSTTPEDTTAPAGATQKDVSSLDHASTYHFRIRARNIDGDGEWSDWANIQTHSDQAPTFNNGTSARELAENSPTGASVGEPIKATDPDNDPLEYSIVGTNTGQFTIAPNSGQLKAGPITYDHEKLTSYTITVQVADTTIVKATAQKTVTVSITDEPEPPAPPNPPDVTAGTSPRTLNVQWEEPANTGPPIKHYDVAYKKNRSSGWTTWVRTDTRTNTVITGLLAGTSYQVRVRAINDEGEGEYSQPGTGSTAANLIPTFNEDTSSGVSRDITENVGDARDTGRIVGDKVAATDGDGGTIQYAISGADASKFTINGSTGQISTISGKRYDHEADPSHVVTVSAKDLHDGETTQAITVDVTINVINIAEKPLQMNPPRFSSTTRTQTTVSWEAPNNNGRPNISEYHYQQSINSASDSAPTYEQGDTSETIRELEDGTTYWFRVRAYNPDGPGEWSEWAKVDMDPNRAPVFNSNTNTASIDENEDVGTAVNPRIGASDQDRDELTYKLVGSNTGGFTIDSTNGQIQSGQVYDFEDNETPYTVNVEVTDTFGESVQRQITINVNDVSEPPSKPDKPSTTQQSLEQLAFTWTAPENTGPPITGYEYQYRTDGTSWTPAQPTTGTSATLSGLSQNTQHHFHVRAKNDEGTSGWSDTNVTSTNQNALPNITQGSAVTFSIPENTTSVTNVGTTLAVTDSNLSDGGRITWSITTSGAPFQLSIGTGTLPNAQVQTRAGANYDHETKDSYTFTVNVADGQGGSDTISVTVNITDVAEQPDTPAAPTNTSRTLHEIGISWTKPENTGPPISDYDVRYAVDETTPTWTEWDHDDTSLNALVQNLARGTTYNFQVRAYNSEMESEWSRSGQFTTLPNAAPTLNTAATLTITIDENTPGGSNIGNPITVSDSNDDNPTIAISGTNASLFEITATGQIKTKGTTNFDYEQEHEHTYTFVITADDGFGGTDTTSVTVNVRNVNEKPEKPDQMTFSNTTSTSLTAHWTEPANTGPTITKYQTEYSISNSGSGNHVEHENSVTSRNAAGLTPGTTYWFRVRAYNTEEWSDWSNPSAVTAIANDTPTFDETTNTVNRRFDENTPSNQNIGGPVSATDTETTNLRYSLIGADADSFKIVASSGQIQTKARVTYDYEGTQNTYSVAVQTTDEHGGSTTKAVTISLNDMLEKPETPAAPTALITTITAITIQWIKPANTGPEISDYDVQYIKSDFDHTVAANWTDWNHNDDSTEDTITDLERGTTYRFRVNAYNDEIRSDWSSHASYPTTANAGPTFDATNSRTINVPENTPGGSDIGDKYQATDDNEDPVEYILSGTNDDLFNIDSSTGQVSTKASTNFDYEQSPNNYTIIVSATDGNAGTSSLSVTVNETDVDEPPGQPNPVTFHDITSTSMTLKWAEPTQNSGPPVDRYLLQYAQTETGPWTQTEFNSNVFELALEELTSGQSYWAQVQAHNAEGWGQFSTLVNQSSEPNEVPVFDDTQDPAARELAENTAANQPVGAPISATDMETTNLVYSMHGTDESYFEIDTQTGQILTKTGVTYNFEDPKNSYQITVTATDSHNTSASRDVHIDLTDEIEPPEAPNAPTISEETATSISITWDEPTNTGPEITNYGVQYQTGTSTEWTDLDHTGTARFATFNDLEPSQAFKARVNATSDEGTSPWSDPVQTNTLINEIPVFRPEPELEDPNFVDNQYQFEIPEDSPPQTEVGTVTAYDPDNTVITYSLSTQPDAAKFSIDQHSGYITTAAAAEFDYETTTSHSFEAIASDTHGDTSSVTVVVNIIDVEEPPAPPNLSADGISFNEATINWTPGENKGPPITAYDIRYRADGNNEYVELTAGASESSVKLKDLTAQTAYEVSGRATNDEGQSGWSTAIIFTTTVNNAPTFPTTSSHVSIDENVPGGTHVITVAAEDTDRQKLSYTIDGDDADQFSINADTGRVVTADAAEFDYESKATYIFTITASDPYELHATQHITVSINNVDEEPTGRPVILGINKIGETLTVDMSGVDDPDGMLNPPAFQYRWTASGSYLANQTSPELDLTQMHSRKYIIIEVRFDDAAGNSETVHSDAFGPIDPRSGQPITPEPTPEPTPRTNARTNGYAYHSRHSIADHRSHQGHHS